MISQLMKLTHLIGVSSSDSMAAGAVLRTYTFPFIAHCLASSTSSTNTNTGSETEYIYGVTPFLLLFYSLMAGISTYFARNRIVGQMLLALTWKESGDIQHITASLGCYCAFLTVIFHVFRPNMTNLRRYVIVVYIYDEVHLMLSFICCVSYV